MCKLFTKRKNKSQQCQKEHAEGHKVFKVIVLHMHHLDSVVISNVHPATRLSYMILSHFIKISNSMFTDMLLLIFL